MRNKRIFFTCLIILSSVFKLSAQDQRFKNLFLEYGMDFINCSQPDDKSYIRGDVAPTYYYGYEPGNLSALMIKYYAGIKAEFKILDNLLGLSGGLRYTLMESSLGKKNYWTSGSDYLYLLFKQEGTSTEYLRIRHIKQTSGYLSIPLEMRIYPYREHFIQLYYKIGFDLSFLVSSRDNISFVNRAMEAYEKEANRIIEDPLPFYASTHLAIGLKVGKPDKAGVNLEACVPTGIIYNFNRSTLVKPYAGGGFQFNVRIPLHPVKHE